MKRQHATSRVEWRATYRQARTDITYREQYHEQATFQVQCPECQCTCHRESDMKTHKCLGERQKLVSEQRGALQCPTCKRWFHSRGGFTVHTCRPQRPLSLELFGFAPIVGGCMTESGSETTGQDRCMCV